MDPYYVDAIVPALAVFSITCLIFGFAAFKRYLKHKESLSEKQSMVDTEELEMKFLNQEKTNQALRERIEALESIVTQEEYELNRKFKAL
jgi:hypothetical protein